MKWNCANDIHQPHQFVWADSHPKWSTHDYINHGEMRTWNANILLHRLRPDVLSTLFKSALFLHVFEHEHRESGSQFTAKQLKIHLMIGLGYRLCHTNEHHGLLIIFTANWKHFTWFSPSYQSLMERKKGWKKMIESMIKRKFFKTSSLRGSFCFLVLDSFVVIGNVAQKSVWIWSLAHYSLYQTKFNSIPKTSNRRFTSDASSFSGCQAVF